ncbi:MAG TPA: gliding motility-associated C-terminal domain-containing protein, partial [Flavobacteriales bacterium]|nr:gliding motility-associated C-terminal domain-containing protein [Flavobacteriales bacterium]
YMVLPSDVIIPNVFSPDGDGHNDALEFENAQYFNNNHLRVYNRWGQVVYESTSYKNNWRPRDVPEGTYYFVFAMQDGRKWAGHVTLLRTN